MFFFLAIFLQIFEKLPRKMSLLDNLISYHNLNHSNSKIPISRYFTVTFTTRQFHFVNVKNKRRETCKRFESIIGIESNTVYFRAKNSSTRGTWDQLCQLDFPLRITWCFHPDRTRNIGCPYRFYYDLSKVKRLSLPSADSHIFSIRYFPSDSNFRNHHLIIRKSMLFLELIRLKERKKEKKNR